MQAPPVPLPLHEQPSAISRTLVHHLAALTGRGPTQVRTYITGDVITLVMRDTLTKTERALVREGQVDLVISLRRAVQQALAPSVLPLVEAITGRQVCAFLSDRSVDPDISVKSFVLVPERKQAGPAKAT